MNQTPTVCLLKLQGGSEIGLPDYTILVNDKTVASFVVGVCDVPMNYDALIDRVTIGQINDFAFKLADALDATLIEESIDKSDAINYVESGYSDPDLHKIATYVKDQAALITFTPGLNGYVPTDPSYQPFTSIQAIDQPVIIVPPPVSPEETLKNLASHEDIWLTHVITEQCIDIAAGSVSLSTYQKDWAAEEICRRLNLLEEDFVKESVRKVIDANQFEIEVAWDDKQWIGPSTSIRRMKERLEQESDILYVLIISKPSIASEIVRQRISNTDKNLENMCQAMRPLQANLISSAYDIISDISFEARSV